MTTPFKGEPARLGMSGQPGQVWAGGPSSNGVSILFINQDPVNTIYLGYNNSISVGGANTVALGPGASANMDGSRTIYAVGVNGAGPLQVIPGGTGFFQPLSSLTIPIGATTGERIVINATLNGVPGYIVAYNASNQISYVIGPNGLFFYSG